MTSRTRRRREQLAADTFGTGAMWWPRWRGDLSREPWPPLAVGWPKPAARRRTNQRSADTRRRRRWARVHFTRNPYPRSAAR